MRSADRRDNMIICVQKNLQSMKEEAQEYIQKHQAVLPPICKPRHYLFQSFSKTGTRNSPPQSNLIKEQNQPVPHKKTVYNLQFSQRYTQKKSQNELKVRNMIMNSTSLKLRMSGQWKAKSLQLKDKKQYPENISGSAKQMKKVVLNSQTLEEGSKDLRISSKQLDSLSTIQFSNKQQEILSKYLNRFKHSGRSQSQPPRQDKYLDNFPVRVLTKPYQIQQQRSYLKKGQKTRKISFEKPIGENKKARKIKNSQIEAKPQADFEYTPWDYHGNGESDNDFI